MFDIACCSRAVASLWLTRTVYEALQSNPTAAGTDPDADANRRIVPQVALAGSVEQRRYTHKARPFTDLAGHIEIDGDSNV